jgi:FkbM family methyltransferase
VPQLGSTFQRLQGRLRFEYDRLALAWRARRAPRANGPTAPHQTAKPPTVVLHPESGIVCVDVGTRKIHVPHVRRSTDFSAGVGRRLDTVAEKYFGVTGYRPHEGDLVIDIGAGSASSRLGGRCGSERDRLLEPDPRAFACLEKNTASSSGVQIYPYALWKERTNLRLHGSLDTAESSLIEDGRADLRNTDVEAWPLDGLQFMVRVPVIAVMKLDGEGVEPEILASATRTLARTRIVVVDVGAIDRRPNLKSRVVTALGAQNFRTVDIGRDDTVLALNIAMVGPVSNRVLAARGS